MSVSETDRQPRDRLSPARSVPSRPMAARPVSIGRRTNRQCHVDAVAGVETRAAHLGGLPTETEITRAHFGIGLEAARGDDHRAGQDILRLAAGAANPHAGHRLAVEDELGGAGVVPDLDLPLLCRRC
jgi:hypothetical protein